MLGDRTIRFVCASMSWLEAIDGWNGIHKASYKNSQSNRLITPPRNFSPTSKLKVVFYRIYLQIHCLNITQ
jgi:hypothetical protein